MKFSVVVVFNILLCLLNGKIVSAYVYSEDPFISITGSNILVKPAGDPTGSFVTEVAPVCQYESQKGVCTKTEEACEKLGGKFIGYCYADVVYKGACCVGLSPERARYPLQPPPWYDATTAAPTTANPWFPNLPTFPSLPPMNQTAPTFPSLPPMNQTAPTFPSVTFPPINQTAPPFPTMPPMNMTAPPLPSLPPMNQTAPTFPSVTFPPINQTAPPFPTMPPMNMTAPPLPSLPPMNQTAPTFPSVTLPPMNMTAPPLPSLPPMNQTAPTFPEVTLPPMNMTAPPLPSLPPMNMTAPPLPSLPPMNQSLPTAPALPTLSPTTAATTAATPAPPDVTTAATPAPPDVTTAATPAPPAAAAILPPSKPQEIAPESELLPPEEQLEDSGPNCGLSTSEVESYFSNPSYPSLDSASKVYQYVVHPKDGYTALRVEVLEALLAGKNGDTCAVDSLQILNTADGPTATQCGLLQGYQYTVRMVPNQPVTIVVTTQSSAYSWNIRVKQIKSSKISTLQDYQSKYCGIKNQGAFLKSSAPETVRTVPVERFFKTSKKRTFAEIATCPKNSVIQRVLKKGFEAQSELRIYRGNETGINEWPWQALILLNGHPICGASIISDQYLITAGHCTQLSLEVPLVSLMTVDVGDHDLRTVSETKNVVMRVARIIPNIAYQKGVTNHGDIAIIKLAGRLKLDGYNVRPVCLPNQKNPEETYAGKTATTTGWGKTEDSVISPVLREAEVKVITNQECKAGWNSIVEGAGDIMIEDGMVCVDGGDTGPCNGDSGGPLVNFEENKWRLIGLTSFGSMKGCAAPGIPSVYTRITSYLGWIAASIAE